MTENSDTKKYKKFTAVITVIFAAVLIIAAFFCVLYPRKYSREIAAASAEFGVSANLVRAVVRTESSFRSGAVSRAGAVGLMQLMPKTAEWVAESMLGSTLCDLSDPAENIRIGTAYLRYLLGKYELSDALAAYNAGEGNLLRWKREGVGYAYEETRNYVKHVLRAQKIYDVLCG